MPYVLLQSDTLLVMLFSITHTHTRKQKKILWRGTSVAAISGQCLLVKELTRARGAMNTHEYMKKTGNNDANVIFELDHCVC